MIKYYLCATALQFYDNAHFCKGGNTGQIMAESLANTTV